MDFGKSKRIRDIERRQTQDRRRGVDRRMPHVKQSDELTVADALEIRFISIYLPFLPAEVRPHFVRNVHRLVEKVGEEL